MIDFYKFKVNDAVYIKTNQGKEYCAFINHIEFDNRFYSFISIRSKLNAFFFINMIYLKDILKIHKINLEAKKWQSKK